MACIIKDKTTQSYIATIKINNKNELRKLERDFIVIPTRERREKNG